jgi:hypothetical protein
MHDVTAQPSILSKLISMHARASTHQQQHKSTDTRVSIPMRAPNRYNCASPTTPCNFAKGALAHITNNNLPQSKNT